MLTVRSTPDKDRTPPNLLELKGHSGVDHPPHTSEPQFTGCGVSFGEIPAPHQLQLGEQGPGSVLSTLTGPTQDSDRRERTSVETPPIISREHDKHEAVVKYKVHSDKGSVDGSVDYVHSKVEEGEEKEEEADVYGCAHSNGLPVCGFVKANLDGETESQNVAAGVCGDAYTSGSPTCRFVKASPDAQSHKRAHSRESSTCGHCDYAEPSSRTEPLASVSSCAHSNGLPVCGFVKANSENAHENITSTAAAAIMLKSAGILRNGIQESNVRILKNEIQHDGSNGSDDWILKCSKKKKREP